MRAAELSDAAGIAAVYRPYVTDTAVSFEEVPPSAAEIRRRMSRPPRLPWYLAARDGAVVGYSYASHHREQAAYRWSVDCSVYLAAPELGRGTGRALYEILLASLRELGYVNAFAGITLPNDASVALHTALGFTSVGVFRDVGFKHGAWHDVQWLQRPLSSVPQQPSEPAPWTPGP